MLEEGRGSLVIASSVASAARTGGSVIDWLDLHNGTVTAVATVGLAVLTGWLVWFNRGLVRQAATSSEAAKEAAQPVEIDSVDDITKLICPPAPANGSGRRAHPSAATGPAPRAGRSHLPASVPGQAGVPARYACCETTAQTKVMPESSSTRACEDQAARSCESVVMCVTAAFDANSST